MPNREEKIRALSMEVLKENMSEIDIGASMASFKKFLDSQNDLFNSQVDQLGSIVLRQCEITGVNPLSQEMVCCWKHILVPFG